MYQIGFTEPAEEDLRATLRYISHVLDSPAAARDLLSETERQLETIAAVPYSCPLVRDDYLASKAIRSLRVKNYRLFYVVNQAESTVSVIRFLYARRDWEKLLQADVEPH